MKFWLFLLFSCGFLQASNRPKKTRKSLDKKSLPIKFKERQKEQKKRDFWDGPLSQSGPVRIRRDRANSQLAKLQKKSSSTGN